MSFVELYALAIWWGTFSFCYLLYDFLVISASNVFPTSFSVRLNNKLCNEPTVIDFSFCSSPVGNVANYSASRLRRWDFDASLSLGHGRFHPAGPVRKARAGRGTLFATTASARSACIDRRRRKSITDQYEQRHVHTHSSNAGKS